MIGRAVSETGAIEPAAADVPRGDLDLGRMLLNVCISVVLESATMRPTEFCFSSEELDSIAFCTIDVTLMGCFGGSLAVNNCCSSWFFGQHLPFILGTPSAADVNVDILHLLPFIVFSWLSGWCIAVVLSLIWLDINTLPNAKHTPENLHSAGGILRTLLRVYAT